MSLTCCEFVGFCLRRTYARISSLTKVQTSNINTRMPPFNFLDYDDMQDNEPNETMICLNSESEVELLLLQLGELVNGSIKRRNELRHRVHKSLEKAKARYVSGGSTSAVVSMRQVQKMRIEEARQGALWCKLMGIFVQIQAELDECKFFSSGDPVLVELELEFFESTAESVQAKIHELRNILEDDKSLYKELNDLLTESPSN